MCFCKPKVETLYIIRNASDLEFELTIISMDNSLYYYTKSNSDIHIYITRNEGKRLIKFLLDKGYYLYYENYPFS